MQLITNIVQSRFFNPLSLAILVGGLFCLEFVRPLRRRTEGRPRRLAVNLAITLMSLVVAALTVRPLSLWMANSGALGSIGVLHWIAMPSWLRTILAILLLDLTFYYWHRLNHEVPLLWRFHAIHHADPDLDVSTSFRFHPVETLYSTAFRAAQIVLIGISPAAFVLYELIFQSGTVFHHSNVRIPERVEWWLNRVVVTPRMHGVHHSVIRAETNANYGVVFRWWDALHRTLVRVPQSALTIGVAPWLSGGFNRIGSMLMLPFKSQPDFSRMADGTHVTQRISEPESPHGR